MLAFKKNNNGICSPTEWQNIIDKLTIYMEQLNEIIKGLKSDDYNENMKANIASINFTSDFGSNKIPEQALFIIENYAKNLSYSKKITE